MKKHNTVGILGYGEVGKAIATFYKNPKIKDKTRDDGIAGVEVLHVCIPWSNTFLKIVEREIRVAQPSLVIVHSTVAPGATHALALKYRGMVVHNPIRGIHPNLHKGIKTFVNYIGADNKKAGMLAAKHLRGLGINTTIFHSSKATEIGKLLDTTYYGLCIAWHGEMKKLTDAFDVKFEEAVTDFNRTYNQGYKKLGKESVVRPVLYPPQKSIGGHCVIPNAKILKKYLSSKAIDLILSYGD